jgi:hypothetical protein
MATTKGIDSLIEMKKSVRIGRDFVIQRCVRRNGRDAIKEVAKTDRNIG